MVDKRQLYCDIDVARRRGGGPDRGQISAYGLPLVKRLVRERKVLIHQQPLRDAWRDFGWKEEKILNAISRLQIKHFYKHEPFWENPSIEMDYYKARGVNGEDVYTHFHVEDSLLIISSFKRIEEAR